MTTGYVIAGSWRNKLSTPSGWLQEQIDGSSIVLHTRHIISSTFCYCPSIQRIPYPLRPALSISTRQKTINTSTMYLGLNNNCSTSAQPSHKSTDSVVLDKLTHFLGSRHLSCRQTLSLLLYLGFIKFKAIDGAWVSLAVKDSFDLHTLFNIVYYSRDRIWEFSSSCDFLHPHLYHLHLTSHTYLSFR